MWKTNSIVMQEIKELILNTPEKYWVIIAGYHFHKSFWGILILIIGGILFFLWENWYCVPFIIIGSYFLIASILGQKYTHGKYKLVLWEKLSKK